MPSTRRPKVSDIFCESECRRRSLEKEFGVPMTREDFEFVENMRTSRTAYCTSFTDKKWKRTVERRVKLARGLERLQLCSLQDLQMLSSVSSMDIELEDENNNTKEEGAVEVDEEVEQVGQDEEFVLLGNPKRKRTFVAVSAPKDDDLPSMYLHLRDSE